MNEIAYSFPEDLTMEEKLEIVQELNNYYDECLRLQEEDINAIAKELFGTTP